MARKRKKSPGKWKKQLTFELTGLFLFIVSLITFARLGVVGEGLMQVFHFFLGSYHVVLTIFLSVFSLYLMIKRQLPYFWSRKLIGTYLFVFSLSLLSHKLLFDRLSAQAEFLDHSVIRNTFYLYRMQLQGEPVIDDLGGGMIGALGYAVTHFLFSSAGSMVFAIGLLITSIVIITGKSFIDVLRKSGGSSASFLQKCSNWFKTQAIDVKTTIVEWKNKWNQKREDEQTAVLKKKQDESIDGGEEEPIIYHFSAKAYDNNDQGGAEVIDVESIALKDNVSEEKEKPQQQEEVEVDIEKPETTSLVVSAKENEFYELPALDLLASPVKANQSREHSMLSKNARKLERTLESFGVSAKVTKVHLGPSVTKYEVYPSVGVKVSKIVNLTDDLALALAAKDIRMEAPIPGKSAIGIEVPNQEVALVTLKEVLESQVMKEKDSKLAIGLGRDISGDAVIAELNKMPHLLVAGATGSGKSVCINGIIISILMRCKPHEVKLMMIDPKMVELNIYNGVPHLLSPVVTDPKKASQALKKVVNEMERRYELFAYSGTRNIEGYNMHIKRENDSKEEGDQHQPLPYIVVIVDELADLMMVASSDVEDSITRLAQMARAAGIHLIIATQRPSVDVITGVIKANIPSRIAFGVSSSTDSRTILDGNGAEKLLGKGDMLFLPVGANKATRIQGAFLSDDEVERVVFHCIEQQKAQYAEEMMPQEGESVASHDVDDELYDDAVQLVVDMQTASVSMLQRRFRIGYTRAARLIDEMEVRGIVGPYEGSKPREVLIAKQEDQEVSNQ
ncbi:FtsK/SpoIIIE family DNA translocase [Evansella cellulosilytica]|uniref:Cell division protein FtsK/SpoIIIE n=1 Tax=Evansella cellulosilytica (strain ATCC 21833 / DSM 2522 / FERM P-1141 / JCM 9156 / N-4) TaxID=649639 RepID=E6TS42_EVAC2|nr:DNA translocase FtsK [Evansella cellulosilytica]ADU30696.1 cell division protein FtsK/SpoIIIE [Evansella cellulosilytica DSM 2522]